MPIVRTFITVVAGIGRMDRRRFFTWSAVGAVLWATGVTLLGYFLGQAFPVLQDKLELAMLAIVAVSLSRRRWSTCATVAASTPWQDERRRRRPRTSAVDRGRHPAEGLGRRRGRPVQPSDVSRPDRAS